MKHLVLSVLAFLMSFGWFSPAPESTAPHAIPLCHGGLPNDMSAMAADPAFQAMHDAPLPFVYTGPGETISFTTPDGKTASGFLLKAPKKSNKWLFVYQEWWGLNDYIKAQSEAFHKDLDDVNVLALDMYDGQVATTPQDAGKLMQGAKTERLEAIINGAVSHVGSKAKIASVGWCFGGMLSLKSAILGGKQVVGCVMYYGRPEKDVEKLKMLNTDVLGLFGNKDRGIPPTMVAEFEENMKKADKKVTVKMYDADHAFANPSANERYNKAAADDAYGLAIGYLKGKYK